MPTLKAGLSSGSIGELLKQVEQFKKKVEAAPEKIVSSLIATGEEEMQDVLNFIKDGNGNDIGFVGSEQGGGHGVVYNRGDQVAYLEFGTGPAGASSPHPDADEHDWNYSSGDKIRRMKNGKLMWTYYDKLRGHYRITEGLPAQMQTYMAAKRMRRELEEKAREALE